MNGISVVLPCYKEPLHTVETLIWRLHYLLIEQEHEIIIVHDGCDEDGAYIESLTPGFLRLEYHTERKGYGASLKTAIKSAKYDTIVICDADGTYDIEALPRMLESYSNDLMIVAGRREINYPSFGWLKKSMRWTLTYWANLLAGGKFYDINSGFRIFSKSQIMPFLDPLCDTFSFTTGLSMWWALSGKSIVYITTDYATRVGKSKVNFWRDGPIAFWQTIRIWMMHIITRKILMPYSEKDVAECIAAQREPILKYILLFPFRFVQLIYFGILIGILVIIE